MDHGPATSALPPKAAARIAPNEPALALAAPCPLPRSNLGALGRPWRCRHPCLTCEPYVARAPGTSRQMALEMHLQRIVRTISPSWKGTGWAAYGARIPGPASSLVAIAITPSRTPGR
jgi:hypothetical protein